LTVLVALENKGKSEEIIFQHKLQIARDLFKNNYPKEKIRNLLNFINLILFLNKNELQNNFLEEVNVLRGKKEVMGIEELIKERLKIEGREEGLEEGIAIGMEKGMEKAFEISILHILRKQPKMTDAEIADLLEVPVAKVQKLRASLQQP